MRLIAAFIVMFSFMSCGMTEKEARNKCYTGHIGKYIFDLNSSLIDTNISKDIQTLNGLVITFKSDSTFYTNKSTYILDDTVGRWDAGTCGFESSGMLSFKNTPNEIVFGPCRIEDSAFNINGIYSDRLDQSQRYSFKRVP